VVSQADEVARFVPVQTLFSPLRVARMKLGSELDADFLLTVLAVFFLDQGQLGSFQKLFPEDQLPVESPIFGGPAWTGGATINPNKIKTTSQP
jgi:hypothetical protein